MHGDEKYPGAVSLGTPKRYVTPDITINMRIKYYGNDGTVIKLSSYSGDNNYCVLKLDKPFKGCTIIELPKSEFEYWEFE